MPFACLSLDCAGEECVELTERESKVCATICSSEEPATFTQIKQANDLHQEVVARVLHRLTVHGLVRKTDDGRYAGRCCCAPGQ